MIRKRASLLLIKTESFTRRIDRPDYGKIKEAPPFARQAIAMACLLAGASVGARAARRQNANGINAHFGTILEIGATGVISTPFVPRTS